MAETRVTMSYQITFSYEREFASDQQAAEVAYTDLRDRLEAGGNGGYSLSVSRHERPQVAVYDDEGGLKSRRDVYGRIHMDSGQLEIAKAIVAEEKGA